MTDQPVAFLAADVSVPWKGNTIVRLTTNEVVAMFDLDEGRVRKDVEHGILGTATPPRFDLADIVYLRTVAALGFELGAVADRKRLRALVRAAVRDGRASVAFGPITEIRIEATEREVTSLVTRFSAWKDQLITDPQIIGGEPAFPRSRLAVRQIGGMRLRGATPAELREDYPYLSDDDIELAARFARAYPKMGRPGARSAAAR
jgi:uncharacterized protein (DUF433 family)